MVPPGIAGHHHNLCVMCNKRIISKMNRGNACNSSPHKPHSQGPSGLVPAFKFIKSIIHIPSTLKPYYAESNFVVKTNLKQLFDIARNNRNENHY